MEPWSHAVRVAVLPMRSAMSNLDEPELLQDPRDLTGLEDGHVAHLRDLDGLRSDELAFQPRLAVLEEHRDDLFEVCSQLIDAGAL